MPARSDDDLLTCSWLKRDEARRPGSISSTVVSTESSALGTTTSKARRDHDSYRPRTDMATDHGTQLGDHHLARGANAAG